jgi:hypothetical protein
MIEEIRSFETSVLTTTTRRYIPEDCILQISSFYKCLCNNINKYQLQKTLVQSWGLTSRAALKVSPPALNFIRYVSNKDTWTPLPKNHWGSGFYTLSIIQNKYKTRPWTKQKHCDFGYYHRRKPHKILRLPKSPGAPGYVSDSTVTSLLVPQATAD